MTSRIAFRAAAAALLLTLGAGCAEPLPGFLPNAPVLEPAAPAAPPPSPEPPKTPETRPEKPQKPPEEPKAKPPKAKAEPAPTPTPRPPRRPVEVPAEPEPDDLPTAAAMPMPNRVGTIRLVNAGVGFVLIDVGTVEGLPPGTALKTFSPGTSPTVGRETAVLTVAPERRRPFVVANIVTGNPRKGDSVFQ